ncbi:MAG: hypothetical protein ABIP64_10750 [Burkholderiales bacterium]
MVFGSHRPPLHDRPGGKFAWVVFAGVLLVLQAASSFGPLPDSMHAMVGSGLTLYIVIALARGWVEWWSRRPSMFSD